MKWILSGASVTLALLEVYAQSTLLAAVRLAVVGMVSAWPPRTPLYVFVKLVSEEMSVKSTSMTVRESHVVSVVSVWMVWPHTRVFVVLASRGRNVRQSSRAHHVWVTTAT